MRESHVFGGMVEVSVDEILWEDKIPAYIVTIIPQMKAEETKNYYLYNRSIDRVVKKISVATVSLNLTKTSAEVLSGMMRTSFSVRKRAV